MEGIGKERGLGGNNKCEDSKRSDRKLLHKDWFVSRVILKSILFHFNIGWTYLIHPICSVEIYTFCKWYDGENTLGVICDCKISSKFKGLFYWIAIRLVILYGDEY